MKVLLDYNENLHWNVIANKLSLKCDWLKQNRRHMWLKWTDDYLGLEMLPGRILSKIDYIDCPFDVPNFTASKLKIIEDIWRKIDEKYNLNNPHLIHAQR